MVLKVYKPTHFAPLLTLPASKSISNRALLLNWLSGGGDGLVSNVADCDDTEVLKEALAHLGNVPLDIHGAGTAMRFLTAALCIASGKHILTGNSRMQQRPIGVLVEALRALGADITYLKGDGFPPLQIEGKELHGGTVSMKGDTSSQYVSALMMIGPLLKGGLRLVLEGDIVSRPYIEMTRRMMNLYGVEARWEGEGVVAVPEGCYKSVDYEVEGDWSGASYWYEMAAFWRHIGNETTLRLNGLTPPEKSLQGDSAIAEIMEKKREASFDHDFSDTPDLVPTMAVTCALTDTPFVFRSVRNLRIKETDRLLALQRELAKLGVYAECTDDDTFFWKGSKLQPQGGTAFLQPKAATVIETYDDHRMAMAFAPACIVLGSISIAHAEVVEKSYPHFWNDLRNCGFKLEEQQ